MKKVIINTPLLVLARQKLEGADPKAYAAAEIARFHSIKTPGRKAQARLAAGRNAMALALFELVPELGGNFRKLTKAIRAGMGADVDFDAINEQGAQALGL